MSFSSQSIFQLLSLWKITSILYVGERYGTRCSMFPSFPTSKTILKLVCDTEILRNLVKSGNSRVSKVSFEPKEGEGTIFGCCFVFLKKKKKKKVMTSRQKIKKNKKSDNSYRASIKFRILLLQLAMLFTKEIIGNRVYLAEIKSVGGRSEDASRMITR